MYVFNLNQLVLKICDAENYYVNSFYIFDSLIFVYYCFFQQETLCNILNQTTNMLWDTDILC
jgi:hypothetical protein